MEKLEKFSFIPELIQTNLKAKNSDEVIDSLTKKMEERGAVQEGYADLVKEREIEFPTGLRTPGAVIAMPHAFDKRNHASYVAVGVLEKPVHFRNMEDFEEELPVEVVFLLAIDEKKGQMSMLQVLMKIFQNKELLEGIKSIKTSEEICQKLNAFLQKL